MSNHQKRLSAPKSWPIDRKEAVFAPKIDGGPHGSDGIPLVSLLRDQLGYADSRNEVEYMLDNNYINVKNRNVSDVTSPVGLFDVIEFSKTEEYFRIFPQANGRLAATKITKIAAETKLGKVIRKTPVPGGNIQLTLHDGENIEKRPGVGYNRKDSVVIDESNNIIAHFAFVEGARAVITDGSHTGIIGEIESIEIVKSSSPNQVIVNAEDGKKYKTIEDNIVVIDRAFERKIDFNRMEERISDDIDYYSRLFALLANGVEPEQIVDDPEISEASGSKIEINSDINEMDSVIRKGELGVEEKSEFAKEFVSVYADNISGSMTGELTESQRKNIKNSVIKDL